MTAATKPKRGRSTGASAPIANRALAVLCVAFALGAVCWAASSVFTVPRERAATSLHTYATVVEGTVEDSIRIRVSAAWESVPAGANQLAGIVTSVNTTPDAPVSAGSILYRVDQRPVFVARGEVPSYRALNKGDVGDDVRQLQGMLKEVGLYSAAVDDRFGSRTERAVRSWHARNGLPETGTVDLGEIIFVPDLPARLELDATVLKRGGALTGGEASVSALSPVPVFSVVLTPTQSTRVQRGTPVSIAAGPELRWNAEVGDPLPQSDGTIAVALRGVDGGRICAECGSIPVGIATQFEADALTTPPRTGLVLPLGALRTLADGSTVITDQKGRNRAIEVVVSAGGRALITGVPAGTRARLQPRPAR